MHGVAQLGQIAGELLGEQLHAANMMRRILMGELQNAHTCIMPCVHAISALARFVVKIEVVL